VAPAGLILPGFVNHAADEVVETAEDNAGSRCSRIHRDEGPLLRRGGQAQGERIVKASQVDGQATFAI